MICVLNALTYTKNASIVICKASGSNSKELSSRKLFILLLKTRKSSSQTNIIIYFLISLSCIHPVNFNRHPLIS